MSESHMFRLDLKRSPAPSLDPADVEEIRAAIRLMCENRVSMAGRLEGELMFVGLGYTESAKAEGAVELGEEVYLAAMLRAYGTGEDALRRFRYGEISVEGRRLAAVVELLPGEPDRWWRAVRKVGTGAAQVGVFHGDWEVREGSGLVDLEEGLHEWIDVSKIEVSRTERALTPRASNEDIRMAVAEVQGELPGHPCEVAQVLASKVDAELVAPVAEVPPRLRVPARHHRTVGDPRRAGLLGRGPRADHRGPRTR